jgi:hypothetical protein
MYTHANKYITVKMCFRDRSLFIVQGGLRRNWGGALNFLKSERGAFRKYREAKEGGL